MKDPVPTRLVMVVDDDPAMLGLLERLLSGWGYRTSLCATFADAKASIERVVPDALVVDVRLGEHNGLHLVHMSRQAHPEMVIVVVSGFDDPVLREEAARVGAKYLLKTNELTNLQEYLPAPTAG
jgi:two-component system response regulator RegA